MNVQTNKLSYSADVNLFTYNIYEYIYVFARRYIDQWTKDL